MEIKERIEKVLEKKKRIQELRSSLNKQIQNHESTYSCELDAARSEYDREMAEIWKKYEAKVAEIKRRKDADYAALINEEYKTQQAIDTLENELRTSYDENTVYIRAKKDGIIRKIEALKVGKLASYLGAGRKSKEDKIDYGAGVKILVNDGDVVKTNQELAILYVKDQNIKLDDELLDIFEIDETN